MHKLLQSNGRHSRTIELCAFVAAGVTALIAFVAVASAVSQPVWWYALAIFGVVVYTGKLKAAPGNTGRVFGGVMIVIATVAVVVTIASATAPQLLALTVSLALLVTLGHVSGADVIAPYSEWAWRCVAKPTKRLLRRLEQHE